MADVIGQAGDTLYPAPTLCTAPRSAVLVDRRHEELIELATHYQKTSEKVISTQSPNVLVNQIIRQMKEYRDTITFAIPYNPSFIGPKKGRSEEDGLDIATRISLDNIHDFANRVATITGKKVSFILLYDSALSLGICEFNILNPADYLTGVQAIHEYNRKQNTDRVQIREWDTVADSMLGFQQRPEFVESGELESAYEARLKKLKQVFGEDGRASLRAFVNKQIQIMQVEANLSATDHKQAYEWIKRTFGIDSLEEARRIALSIELFKRMDAKENVGQIIRLSPHVKDEKELCKYGFAFFPRTCIMIEPWVGNVVARPDRSFVLDTHKKERSFEEALQLEKERVEKEARRAEAERKQKKGSQQMLGRILKE